MIHFHCTVQKFKNCLGKQIKKPRPKPKNDTLGFLAYKRQGSLSFLHTFVVVILGSTEPYTNIEHCFLRSQWFMQIPAKIFFSFSSLGSIENCFAPVMGKE